MISRTRSPRGSSVDSAARLLLPFLCVALASEARADGPAVTPSIQVPEDEIDQQGEHERSASPRAVVWRLPPAHEDAGSSLPTGEGESSPTSSRPREAGAAPAPGDSTVRGSTASDSVPPPGKVPPPAVAAELSPAPPIVARPRFSTAVGAGISFESSGLVGGRTVAVPAFHVQLGVGDGPLGFEARWFSTQASGRYHQRTVTVTGGSGSPDMPPDRLGLDLSMAVRPLAMKYENRRRWRDRVLRTFAVNVGVGAENASVGQRSVIRAGAVIGLHVDLPLLLLSPVSLGSELTLRLSTRRLVAGQRLAGTVTVSDTGLELFAAACVSF